MRSFVLALGLLAAASVTAADNLIPGNLAIVKSAALVKGVYKGTFAVPASPRGALLAVFDTGGASDNYALPEVQWKRLGKRRFEGADPVRARRGGSPPRAFGCDCGAGEAPGSEQVGSVRRASGAAAGGAS